MSIKIIIEARPGEGKTTVAHMIAAHLLEQGLTVNYDPPGDLSEWHTNGRTLESLKQVDTKIKIVERQLARRSIVRGAS